MFSCVGQENKYLTELSLGSNNIGDEGARAIGAGLAVIVFRFTFVGVIAIMFSLVVGRKTRLSRRLASWKMILAMKVREQSELDWR